MIFKFWFSCVLANIVIACACAGEPADALKRKAVSFENASWLDEFVDKASNKKLVMLGESSHGTHEFYSWRDSISRRLISEEGFNFIAVEGDFAKLFELNRYVKNLPDAASSAEEVLRSIDRWPTWMWGNQEIVGLAEWLRQYNDQLNEGQKVGFYGIDVYDEWRSKAALLDHLDNANKSLFKRVKKKLDCFAPYLDDSWAYARDASIGLANCSRQASEVVDLMAKSKKKFKDDDKYDHFFALQNAHVVDNAEKFYRKSAMGRRDESWNARVFHFYETTLRLLDLYGEGSKGIVWAHNTHIGDAGYTEMVNFNQLNIGQLARDGLGRDNVLLVGFTTYTGTVKAGRQWGMPGEVMSVAQAQPNSIEEILNRMGEDAFYIVFDDDLRHNSLISEAMGNRAIGVVFDPRNEPRQYVRTIVPMRYDALFFFRETKALTPLY